MRRLMPLTLIVAATLLSGCGSDVDSLARRQVILYNDLVKAIESDASAKDQGAIIDEITEINRQLDEMNLSEDRKKEVFDKFGKELDRAIRRLAAVRVQKRWSGDVSTNVFEEMIDTAEPADAGPVPEVPSGDDLPRVDDMPVADMPVIDPNIDPEAIEAETKKMQNEAGAMMRNFADQFRQLDQSNPTGFDPELEEQPAP